MYIRKLGAEYCIECLISCKEDKASPASPHSSSLALMKTNCITSCYRYKRRCLELEQELKTMTERANTYHAQLDMVKELNVGLQHDVLNFIKEHVGKLIFFHACTCRLSPLNQVST